MLADPLHESHGTFLREQLRFAGDVTWADRELESALGDIDEGIVLEAHEGCYLAVLDHLFESSHFLLSRWVWQGLNLRPLPCQGSDLPLILQTR